MAVNIGETCMWETETDVTISQEDTYALRQSIPRCLIASLLLPIVGGLLQREVCVVGEWDDMCTAD